MGDVLRIERQEGIATLTLNRPEARNALSSALRSALTTALCELAEDDSVGVAILTGEGTAFCAGNDLKEQGAGERGRNVAEAGGDMDTGLIPAIEGFPKPLIAAVNGFAVTAGFEMALACDIILASETAAFADSHVRVGVLPGWGLSQRLPRLIGFYRASELAYTGRRLSAQEALAHGLVNHVYKDHDSLIQGVMAKAGEIAARSPLAVWGSKEMINYGRDHSIADGLDYIATWQTGMFQPTDMAEAFAAKQEKRAARYPDLLPEPKKR